MFRYYRKILISVFFSLIAISPSLEAAIETRLGFFGKIKGWFAKKEIENEASVASQIKDSLQWKRYDYTQNSGFSVELPGEPDHTGQTVEIPQSEITIYYNTYVTETADSDTIYVISVWEYPDKIDISRPELNLQEGFSGMLQALPESHVLFMQATQVQGYKALEFWISCDNVYFRGILISVNHTLYQVFMVYKNNNPKALDKEYEVFSKSFTITKIKEAKSLPSSIRKKVHL
ncbi:hypothetical protein [Chlamydia sp. 17-3921]|uniref:hypothetical protein n=1 Tax=Chlamydia sp. 17-3921 TaxID=2675798 RepID=UPI001919AA0B|nr:hypothetical protein [Chlamydia sp. 17-3921]